MEKFKIDLEEVSDIQRRVRFNGIDTDVDVFGNEEDGFFFTRNGVRFYPFDRKLQKEEVQLLLHFGRVFLNEVSFDKMR